MSRNRLWAGSVILFGSLYFLLPLVGMFEFSLRMKRGEYSFEAYRVVLADPQFQQTLGYSVALALLTIVLGVLIVVPTAYWVRLRLPGVRPVIEFITLMPLAIPPIVIVFRPTSAFNTSLQYLLFTAVGGAPNISILFGYATPRLPYMYRAVDTGLRTIDIGTLTEAAQSLGAGWARILITVILPNVLVSVLSGAFLTFAIVIGEYVFAALLNVNSFGPYMVWTGSNRAYEPSALAVIAFAITWVCMGLMQLVTRFSKFPTARQ